MDANRRVLVNDVGPRDGLQNQATILSAAQRLELIRALARSGVASIEAGSFVSPKAVPAMAGAGQIFAELDTSGDVEFQALIPNMKGYELARAAGVRQTLLVVAATETMNQENVRMSVEQSMNVAGEIMSLAAADGIASYGCVAVAWECPFEGKTDLEQVRALTSRYLEMGAAGVVLADTIGAANPGSVHDLMTILVNDHGAERLACHFHDTRAMGVANAYAALEAGIRRFDASVGGLGGCPFAPGATGNVATEDLVMMLHQMGYETGIDLPLLMEAGRLAGELVGVESGGRAKTWRELQLQKGRSL
ncbi:MAG: hydroxymethylglutaryl-CoA lyase [Halioglobus sp.]